MKLTYLLTFFVVYSGIHAETIEIAEAEDQNDRSVSSMPFHQGEPLDKKCSAAFNFPAAIDLNLHECRNVKCYVDASFLYWYGAEEGLLVATNGVFNTGSIYAPTTGIALTQTFAYKPGFKVGLGAVIQGEWVVDAEYTWLRGHNLMNSSTPNTTSVTSGTASKSTGTPVWVVANWFLQGTSNGQALSGTNIASKWSYGLDLIDVSASRPYYQGSALTVVPFGGLRCALIRQKMDVALTEMTGQTGVTLPAQPIHSRNKSASWALGPRAGCEVNYLLPVGFRFDGDFAMSLLYTRYTKITHKEDSASTTYNPGPYTYSYHNYGCVRPIAELGLGIGWGRYLSSQTKHIDFSASYDFNLFWAQNMMPKMLAEFLGVVTVGPQDLFFHGLTLSGRFDF